MVLSVCAEKLLEPVAKFGFVAFARGADAFRSGEARGASQGARALELCVRKNKSSCWKCPSFRAVAIQGALATELGWLVPVFLVC